MTTVQPAIRAWTLDELVNFCVALRPDIAAQRQDSALCVTPLIEAVILDGEVHHLKLVDGRWGAVNVRVSTPLQRSEKAGVKKVRKTRKPPRSRQDGYSEEEQITRGIRHFVRLGQAFKIYSDAGVTGEYPNNDPALITKLLHKKADRYRTIFERTLLDETSLVRRTPQEITGMREYLAKRLDSIRRGILSEDELYKPAGQGFSERMKRGLRGRPNKKVYHRQGFTQIWLDIGNDLIHTVAGTDRSRFCRDADLETAFLTHLAQHNTRLFGLIEPLDHLDVSDPLRKGLNYMLASINEARLMETAQNSFRGTVQRLESHEPMGKIPWWLTYDEDGKIIPIEGAKEIIRRLLDLALSGLGGTAIATKMREDGVLVQGKPLQAYTVTNTLRSDALRGVQWYFGIAWNVLPVMVDDDDTWAELERLRSARRKKMDAVLDPDPTTWANHTYTRLLRCTCGMLMSMHYKCEANGVKRRYYACNMLNKKMELQQNHARIREEALDAFFSEVLSTNPHLLTGEFTANVADASANRSARRALLEERLKVANEAYSCRESEARAKAESSVAALGIASRTTHYATTVAAMMEALLEEERRKLESIKHELGILSAEISQDKRSERLMQTVAELEGWDHLDELTRNRLLLTLFEGITIYPVSEGGYVDLQLSGVDVHLPRLKMRRPKRNVLRLPTVAEWLQDIFGLEGATPEVTEARKQSFYYFLGTLLRENSQEARLAQELRREHKEYFLNRYSKDSILPYLREKGVEYEAAANLWQRYEDSERNWKPD